MIDAEVGSIPDQIFYTPGYWPIDPNTWMIVNPPGMVGGPPNWYFFQGVLRQNQAVRGSGGFGAKLIYRRKAWGNVKVKATLWWPQYGGAGLVLRYQDPDNFYRLAIYHEYKLAMLTRVRYGVETTLWIGSFDFDRSIQHTLELMANENTLFAYFDGMNILPGGAFVDAQADNMAGYTGMYSLDKIVGFTEFRVAPY